MKEVRIGAAFHYAWKTVTSNIWFFVGVMIVMIIVPEFIEFLGNDLHQERLFAEWDIVQVSGLALLALSWLISLILNAGMTRIVLAFVEGRKPDFSEILYVGNLLWPYFIASILFGLIIAVGLILLIVPGLIFLTMYQFYALFIFDQRAGIIDSLKRSAALTKGVRWDIFLFMLASLGVNILGLLALGVGLVITIPMVLLAQAHIYRQLLSQMNVVQDTLATTDGDIASPPPETSQTPPPTV
jgi:hypothetical protein